MSPGTANRYAAAEALALAIKEVFGSVRAEPRGGLLLHHDQVSRR
jgi:hypothetical protein